MNDDSVILDIIRKKEAEVQSLEDRLRAARIYLLALRDVLGALGKSAEGGDPGLRHGSSVAKARDAILRAGNPMHVSELLSALGKDVTKETRASLASSLAAYVRRDEIFTRPAPNTFGLIELGHRDGVQAPPAMPPPGFGEATRRGQEEAPFTAGPG